MEQLVQLVVEKTGLSEEMAANAVEIVLQFVRERLPEPLNGQLDNLLNGEADQTSAIGGALKGLFGQ